jgi:hypothetical protein
MNRLTPLIARRPETFAPGLQLELPHLTDEQHSELVEDLRLFATAWLGGLIFFGTLIA